MISIWASNIGFHRLPTTSGDGRERMEQGWHEQGWQGKKVTSTLTKVPLSLAPRFVEVSGFTLHWFPLVVWPSWMHRTSPGTRNAILGSTILPLNGHIVIHIPRYDKPTSGQFETCISREHLLWSGMEEASTSFVCSHATSKLTRSCKSCETKGGL